MLGTRALGTLMVGLVLAGCESATAPDGSAASPAAVAHAVTFNDPHAPFEFIIAACEEDVYGSGVVHILTRATISAAQDTITALHINARGTGVGLSSGTRYRFNDTFRVHTNSISGSPLLVSFTEVLNLIGHGPTANLHVHAVFRMVLNANGIQTVLIDEVRVRCA